jgi:hypothetical protein
VIDKGSEKLILERMKEAVTTAVSNDRGEDFWRRQDGKGKEEKKESSCDV